MKKEFVPYELALRLKELGFDEPCITFYPVDLTLPLVGIYATLGFNGKHSSLKDGYRNSTVNILWTKKYKRNFANVAAPTFSQAFRWFREKYRLSVLIHDCLDDYIGEIIEWTLTDDKIIHEVPNRIETYEETELACLENLIELVKSKSK